MNTVAEVVTVTPEMASEWLLRNRYEYQRPIDERRVKFLVEEIERGNFKEDTPIEFSSVDGIGEWLTDGQHRLTAVAWSETPHRFVVIRRHLPDVDAVALAYTYTDQVRVRKIPDNDGTLRMADELGLSRTDLAAIGVAVMLVNRQFMNKTILVHQDERRALMREYNAAYEKYLEAIINTPQDMRHRVRRGSTVAVGIVTFRYSTIVYGDKVKEFWEGMAHDDGLRQGDPRKVAWKHLIETNMTGGMSIGSSPAYSARYLASCFNAWIGGKTDMRFTKPDISKPIIILGSPFDGK